MIARTGFPLREKINATALHAWRQVCITWAMLFSLVAIAQIPSGEELALSTGQTLYLPVYSHLYHGDPDRSGKLQQTLVSTHVSIRNTDTRYPIRVLSAEYFDTEGKRVRSYLAQPVTLPPMGTHEIFVPRTDTAGGSGANFLIVWKAEVPVSAPRVEALHADIREARTLFFITTAQPVRPAR